MQFAKNAFRLSLLASLCAIGGNASAVIDSGEMIILHPFQWTYSSIARECVEVLGPKGYDGVQISPPSEHINRNDVWWAVYQPVSFWNFTTMDGNESELRDMIKQCNSAGVKVFADAVFNQRASGSGVGIGGSLYSSRHYPDMDESDFHDKGCYGINYGDADSIRFCDLSGMPDVATDRDATRTKIANYLKNLQSMGVYGFRIDAAKHMSPEDIAAILRKAGNPPAYLEVIGADGQPVQPYQYASIDNSVVTDFKYSEVMQSNIYNPQYLIQMNDSWFQLPGYASEVFVANHDNERCSAGTCSINFQNNGWAFQLAQSFMVAYPYGTVRQIYSGYEFTSHDAAGPLDAERCTGGWHCEHRDSIVNNAVGFARATRGVGVTSKGSEGRLIWFNRGSNGFYALNAGDNDVTREFSVEMPDGIYCEILQQNELCGGQQITVHDGKAVIKVPSHSAAAICTGSFCGSVVPPDPCKNNPSSRECGRDRYYVGSSNNWTFTKMDSGSNGWFLLMMLGNDGTGKHKFYITDSPDWNGRVFGASEGNGLALCADVRSCEPASTRAVGRNMLYVGLDNSYTFNMQIGPVIFHEIEAEINGLEVAFRNDSKGSFNYVWDFGDGTAAAGRKLTHVYEKPGKYDVVLTVYDNLESAIIHKTVEVKDDVCRQKYSEMYYAGTSNKWAHDPMSFNSQTCRWEIPLELDGRGDRSGPQRFKITLSPDWKHTVYGTAGGSRMCSNQSACGDIDISEAVGSFILNVDESDMSWSLAAAGYDNHAPSAFFETVQTGPRQFLFTSTSVDPDGDELELSWDFGDGTAATGAVVSHTFSSDESLTVTLVASDGKAESRYEDIVMMVCGDCDYIEATHDALFFAGTSNGWNHEAMKYDPSSGYWKISLVLTGEGDTGGSQRFKITDQSGWKGTVWGDAGGNALCSKQSSCPDVVIDEVGVYTLSVHDRDLTWILQKNAGYVAKHSAMYYAGTSNSWKHEPMTFDTQTGRWYINLDLTGKGDAGGSQRFKITDQAGWNGTVWGRGSDNSLCPDQRTCGDISISETGSHVLYVNDETLTWILEPR
jgi:alpha-amylase